MSVPFCLDCLGGEFVLFNFWVAFPNLDCGFAFWFVIFFSGFWDFCHFFE